MGQVRRGSATTTHATLRDLRKGGVEFYSCTQAIVPDESGDLLRQLLAVVDERRRDLLPVPGPLGRWSSGFDRRRRAMCR